MAPFLSNIFPEQSVRELQRLKDKLAIINNEKRS
jgi:hypothetical protein